MGGGGGACPNVNVAHISSCHYFIVKFYRRIVFFAHTLPFYPSPYFTCCYILSCKQFSTFLIDETDFLQIGCCLSHDSWFMSHESWCQTLRGESLPQGYRTWDPPGLIVTISNLALCNSILTRAPRQAGLSRVQQWTVHLGEQRRQ